MTQRIFWLFLASVLLTACAPTPVRTGVVYDKARNDMQQATNARKSADAVEKALMPPLSVEMPSNVDPDEARFDLAVVNASAPQVFMALVSGTRFNMLVTPEVTGQITVRLKDVTVREALEAIRELYGYEFAIKGNRITIQPNSLQTRVFQVNYLASRRQGATELRVTSSAITGTGAGGGTTSGTAATGTATPGSATSGATSGTASLGSLTSRVQTTTDSDFWGGLTTALTTIVGSGEGRNVVVSPQSGVIVVRALPREIRSIEGYLKATQTIVERQVVLEAKIIDVTLNHEYQAGINWAAFGTGYSGNTLMRGAVGVAGASANLTTMSSATGAATALSANGVSTVTPGKFGSVIATPLGQGFFGLAFQTANFGALLNFLETQGSVSVLSSPRIATLNNQKAVLKVGTDDLFVTNVTTTTTSTTTGSVSTPSLTLQSYFSGISLDVTPQIDDDSNIILHIHPAVSSVTEKEKTIDLGAALGQFKLPLASSSVNETDSIVRARDGNIIAIGGLMRQEQTSDSSQLPGANKFGAVGSLFGQRSTGVSKRELVILLKPTVIADDRAWIKDIAEASDRLGGLDPAQLGRNR